MARSPDDPITSRTIKMSLAYDGTDFFGWQVQPDRRTIQGELADAIERVTGERVLPQGSGRTDAGVHAQGQVASMSLASPIPVENLALALNHTLPPSIRVTGAEEVDRGFHARHSAKAKTYEYRIFRAATCPPFVARYVHHHPYPLEEEAMVRATSAVVGKHDFTSFAASDPERGKEDEPANNVRTVFSSEWRREGDLLIYRVRGNGFLHHMVRNLVGTFLLVGKGSLTLEDVARILASRNRAQAGPTAPASGLFLMSVEY
ncbi:MAG TPA: tRNA pseudouridine(38-40) synthase TruA [Terriglobales bacterium]|nr:tRNA pseudouridine(38-40) synthase TruA [Terriglobales bacterium]